MIWILGEFGEHIPATPYLLETLITKVTEQTQAPPPPSAGPRRGRREAERAENRSTNLKFEGHVGGVELLALALGRVGGRDGGQLAKPTFRNRAAEGSGTTGPITARKRRPRTPHRSGGGTHFPTTCPLAFAGDETVERDRVRREAELKRIKFQVGGCPLFPASRRGEEGKEGRRRKAEEDCKAK